jgi:hypothetical protein
MAMPVEAPSMMPPAVAPQAAATPATPSLATGAGATKRPKGAPAPKAAPTGQAGTGTLGKTAAYLPSLVDELRKIAMSGVEAANAAETSIGNAGIAGHAPMIHASDTKSYLQARKLIPRQNVGARKAFLGHQLNNMTGAAQKWAGRSGRFMRLSRLATGH